MNIKKSSLQDKCKPLGAKKISNPNYGKKGISVKNGNFREQSFAFISFELRSTS
jgi:hypothetical protein